MTTLNLSYALKLDLALSLLPQGLQELRIESKVEGRVVDSYLHAESHSFFLRTGEIPAWVFSKLVLIDRITQDLLSKLRRHKRSPGFRSLRSVFVERTCCLSKFFWKAVHVREVASELRDFRNLLQAEILRSSVGRVI